MRLTDWPSSIRVGPVYLLLAACTPATAAERDPASPRGCDPPAAAYVQQLISEQVQGDVGLVGLSPLVADTLPAGTDEVRLWARRSWVGNVALVRLRRAADSVTGQLVVFNSEFGPRDRHPISARWCERIVERPDRQACIARFAAPVRWDSLLVEAEAHQVWSLPDGSTVPRQPEMMDGGGVSVETRRDGCYRAYGYGAPFVESVPEYRHAGVLERLVLRLDARWTAMAEDTTRR
jgi:hypothetical protein